MKTLRIGAERFTITKRVKRKTRCLNDHPTFTVTTKKAGKFIVCDTCKSTTRIPE